MSEWLVTAHVLVAFWFVAGLVGRDVTLSKARGSSDVHLIGELAGLAGRFERISVRPSSFGVLVLGLLTAWARHVPLAGSGSGWLLGSLILFLSNAVFIPAVFVPRGRVFERELAAALASGEVTSGLSAALHDPAVTAARTYEIVTVIIIIILMVAKPF
jgi:uncharacterized membrane protein